MAAIDILVVVMHILVSQGTGGKHFGERMGIHRSLGISQDWWDMTSAAKEHAPESICGQPMIPLLDSRIVTKRDCGLASMGTSPGCTGQRPPW